MKSFTETSSMYAHLACALEYNDLSGLHGDEGDDLERLKVDLEGLKRYRFGRNRTDIQSHYSYGDSPEFDVPELGDNGGVPGEVIELTITYLWDDGQGIRGGCN